MTNARNALLVIALLVGGGVCDPAHATPRTSPKRQSSDQRQREAERVKAKQALVAFLGAHEAASYKVLWTVAAKPTASTRCSASGRYVRQSGTCVDARSRSRHARQMWWRIRDALDLLQRWHNCNAFDERGRAPRLHKGPVTDGDLVSVASYARSNCFEQALSHLSRDRSLMTNPTDVLGLPFSNWRAGTAY